MSIHAERLGEILASIRGLFADVYEADEYAASKLARCRQTLQEATAKAEARALEYLPHSQWVAYAACLRASLLEVAERYLSTTELSRLAAALPTVEPKLPSPAAEQLQREIDWSSKTFAAAVEKSDATGVCRQAGLLCRIELSLERELGESGLHLTGQQLRELADRYTKRVYAVARPIVGNDDVWAKIVDEWLKKRGA